VSIPNELVALRAIVTWATRDACMLALPIGRSREHVSQIATSSSAKAATTHGGVHFAANRGDMIAHAPKPAVRERAHARGGRRPRRFVRLWRALGNAMKTLYGER
jgi:hypothetical protein